MSLADRSLRGPVLSSSELEALLGDELPLLELLHQAFVVREHYFGRRVQVHVLDNARNARCPEDCGYCSQSAISDAPLDPYEWKRRSEMLENARAAYDLGAFRYCIVASGRGPTRKQTAALAETVRCIKRELPIQVCVSVGLLDEDKALVLKQAGVDRLNHNLNTTAALYPKICTTHTHADRCATLDAARAVGLEQCSGLIMGMGESNADLVEVALDLRERSVASIPLNFLIPIEGNPVQSDGSLNPERCLRALAMLRLANPGAEVRAAGGREGHLGSLEALSLWPANSLFVGGYLTTLGHDALATYRMIRDAGFEVELPDGKVASWAQLGLDEEFRVLGSERILKPDVATEIP